MNPEARGKVVNWARRKGQLRALENDYGRRIHAIDLTWTLIFLPICVLFSWWTTDIKQPLQYIAEVPYFFNTYRQKEWSMTYFTQPIQRVMHGTQISTQFTGTIYISFTWKMNCFVHHLHVRLEISTWNSINKYWEEENHERCSLQSLLDGFACHLHTM